VTRAALPPRRSGQVRRPPTKRVRRSLTWIQILAVGLIAACASGIYAVGISPSFAIRNVTIHGATFTDESIVRSIIGMDARPNAFRIDTDAAARELVKLPAVKSATVQVHLPSTVEVTLVERQPKLVWIVGGHRYVVDEDGLLFGLVDEAGNPIPSDAGPLASPTDATLATETPVDESALPSGPLGPVVEATDTPSPSPSPSPTPVPKKTAKPKVTPKPSPTKKGAATPKPSATPSDDSSAGPTFDASLIPSLVPAPTTNAEASSGPRALGLPVIFDRRKSDAGMVLGSVIDPVNLDAAYRLAAIGPADVGSKAAALAIVLDDDHGFTMSSVPAGWVAEFGFYTPTARRDTVIPIQVRDLRSALANWGENKVAWVYLVSDVSDNHNDTVILR
jgi:hypothetical protein